MKGISENRQESANSIVCLRILVYNEERKAYGHHKESRERKEGLSLNSESVTHD